MATKSNRSIVRDGQGSGALFMMDRADFRHPDGSGAAQWGYSIVTEGQYLHKGRLFAGTNGKVYSVFSDWSVRLVADHVSQKG